MASKKDKPAVDKPPSVKQLTQKYNELAEQMFSAATEDAAAWQKHLEERWAISLQFEGAKRDDKVQEIFEDVLSMYEEELEYMGDENAFDDFDDEEGEEGEGEDQGRASSVVELQFAVDTLSALVDEAGKQFTKDNDEDGIELVNECKKTIQMSLHSPKFHELEEKASLAAYKDAKEWAKLTEERWKFALEVESEDELLDIFASTFQLLGLEYDDEDEEDDEEYDEEDFEDDEEYEDEDGEDEEDGDDEGDGSLVVPFKDALTSLTTLLNKDADKIDAELVDTIKSEMEFAGLKVKFIDLDKDLSNAANKDAKEWAGLLKKRFELAMDNTPEEHLPTTILLALSHVKADASTVQDDVDDDSEPVLKEKDVFTFFTKLLKDSKPVFESKDMLGLHKDLSAELKEAKKLADG